jgi:DNA-binding phage protein
VKAPGASSGTGSVAGVQDTAATEKTAAESGVQTAERVRRHAEPLRDQAAADLETKLMTRELFAQIDQARIEQGMTKAELARRARLSETHVSRLLNHGGNPRLSTLIALVHGVGGRLVLTKDDGSNYDC